MSTAPAGNLHSIGSTEKYRSAHGLNFSETKGACDLAYKAFQGDVYKFPDGKNWTVVEMRTDMSGFRAIVLRPENDRRVVLAFAGTQIEYEFRVDKSGGDLQTDLDQEQGLIPRQYVLAADMAGEWRSKSGNNLILTGHSLGGGLASYACLYNRMRATTINPAPLAESTALRFVPSKNHLRFASVTNYIAAGKEFISNKGVWHFISGGTVNLKLTIVGDSIPVAGGPISDGPRWQTIRVTPLGVPVPILVDSRPVEIVVKYYSDHLISNTAPEVSLPIKQLSFAPGGYQGMTEFDSTMSR